MAVIQDDTGFKIRITPRMTNFLIFDAEFFFKDKPLFNPDVIKSNVCTLDAYEELPLLPVIEKALNCHEPGQSFYWNEWEDEAQIVIDYRKYNNMAEDGIFMFKAYISSWYFKDGDSNRMDQPAGVRLNMIERDTLRKFYEELKVEIQAVQGVTIDK